MKLIKAMCMALITLSLLNACSSKIEGEAFVVTKGGESKKLGLVEVKAYKMSDIEGFKKKLVSEYSAHMDKLAEDYKFDGLKEKHDERKQLLAEMEDAIKKYKKCPEIPSGVSELARDLWFLGCKVSLPKELDAEFQQRKKSIADGALKIIFDKADKVDLQGDRGLDEKFDQFFISKRVEEHTKSLEAVATKTDADGKFSMTLPKGEFLIVATGSRQAFGEDYFWLLKASKGGSIRLANDSLFGQGCETCLFTASEMVELKKKKKVLEKFVGTESGRMMLYKAKLKDTGIYSDFWNYMCSGDPNPWLRKKEGKELIPVFDWAECVDVPYHKL